MATNLNNPKAISEAGVRIYNVRYKADYEAKYNGQFVAVNVLDESATLGKTATDALAEARRLHPNGVFHLIRVGHSAAFEVGLAHRYVDTDRVA